MLAIFDNRSGYVFLEFLLALAYVLLFEHRVHAWIIIPWLVLASFGLLYAFRRHDKRVEQEKQRKHLDGYSNSNEEGQFDG